MADKFKPCSVDGCNGNAAKPGSARGWCSMHYQRWKRSGDPEHVDIQRGAPMRFVDDIALAHDGEDCLKWPFAYDGHGYGQIWFNGALSGAHRVVCEKAHGPAPSPAHDAAHSCGKGHEGCVNPHHLRWDTRKGNFSDKDEHGTLHFGERHASAKLTDDDVRDIRRLAADTPQKDIAKMFGVSKATICAVVNRHRWCHVE